jgi:hypothetical protein
MQKIQHTEKPIACALREVELSTPGASLFLEVTKEERDAPPSVNRRGAEI